ncbi:transposase family protein [Streptomyces globisporus]|uniref:transposase family protein n=1 Tax=Streptomyces globisporus TaxID=1908 RepID=UPI0037BC88CA
MHLGRLIEELAGPWLARCESALRERRGAERQRDAGAGPKHDLVFTDRVLVTLVHLRTGLPHVALAELYGTARSTISRAISEIRPLLAARGFAVPDRPGVRLRTLADVFAYAEAEGIRLRIDGAETQVRCPKAGRPGRRAFVSGTRKQNTIKTTTVSDGQGRLLWSGASRPGRMHDQTAVRTEGITEQSREKKKQVRKRIGAHESEAKVAQAVLFDAWISRPCVSAVAWEDSVKAHLSAAADEDITPIEQVKKEYFRGIAFSDAVWVARIQEDRRGVVFL